MTDDPYAMVGRGSSFASWSLALADYHAARMPPRIRERGAPYFDLKFGIAVWSLWSAKHDDLCLALIGQSCASLEARLAVPGSPVELIVARLLESLPEQAGDDRSGVRRLRIWLGVALEPALVKRRVEASRRFAPLVRLELAEVERLTRSRSADGVACVTNWNADRERFGAGLRRVSRPRRLAPKPPGVSAAVPSACALNVPPESASELYRSVPGGEGHQLQSWCELVQADQGSRLRRRIATAIAGEPLFDEDFSQALWQLWSSGREDATRSLAICVAQLADSTFRVGHNVAGEVRKGVQAGSRIAQSRVDAFAHEMALAITVESPPSLPPASSTAGATTAVPGQVSAGRKKADQAKSARAKSARAKSARAKSVRAKSVRAKRPSEPAVRVVAARETGRARRLVEPVGRVAARNADRLRVSALDAAVRADRMREDAARDVVARDAARSPAQTEARRRAAEAATVRSVWEEEARVAGREEAKRRFELTHKRPVAKRY